MPLIQMTRNLHAQQLPWYITIIIITCSNRVCISHKKKFLEKSEEKKIGLYFQDLEKFSKTQVVDYFLNLNIIIALCSA